MDADAVEIRVLGCLIEKQRTTPDAYPLSLNSLRLACNQATNRDPVVAYEEREIKAALDRMANRGWTRFASGASSRALKYRHLLDEALQLSGPELSLLGVLMLRGAQTVGELKQRSERLHRIRVDRGGRADSRWARTARARRTARAATGTEGGALAAASRCGFLRGGPPTGGSGASAARRRSARCDRGAARTARARFRRLARPPR